MSRSSLSFALPCTTLEVSTYWRGTPSVRSIPQGTDYVESGGSAPNLKPMRTVLARRPRSGKWQWQMAWITAHVHVMYCPSGGGASSRAHAPLDPLQTKPTYRNSETRPPSRGTSSPRLRSVRPPLVRMHDWYSGDGHRPRQRRVWQKRLVFVSRGTPSPSPLASLEPSPSSAHGLRARASRSSSFKLSFGLLPSHAVPGQGNDMYQFPDPSLAELKVSPERPGELSMSALDCAMHMSPAHGPP